MNDPQPVGIAHRRLGSAGSHVAAAPAEPRGRNLAVAVPVALGLIGLLLATVLFNPWPFVVLVCLALVLGSWELCRALAAGGVEVPTQPLALGGVGTQVAAATSGVPGVVLGLGLTVALMVAWRLVDAVPNLPPARDLYAAVFAVLYLPALASFVVLLVFQDFWNYGRWLVIVLIALPVASDTGGYFAGSYLGRHKLAPQVSPKKTWEGLAGSVLLGMVVAAVALWLLDGPIWLGITLGLLGAGTATLGDLAESLLKRELGIKDMGWLLPGHGGVLDRVDSILLTAPMAYIVLTWWLHGGP
ncbi:MAG: phosphatidate cytidylyltransferase [Micrococcales bacterium]|nr:phosphatidate cytidylyltransferase [Micrococcales bacterium]